MKERHSQHYKDVKYNGEEYKNDPFFQRELTKEGQRSLAELFHNTKQQKDEIDDHINCYHAAIYDNYAGKDGDFSYARLRAHILSDPEIIEGKEGKLLVVPVTYFINPTPSIDQRGKKIEKMIDEKKYCVSAICILEPSTGKIKSLTTIDLTVMNSRESAALVSGIESIGKYGIPDTIIVGNAAGRIHQVSLDDGKVKDPQGWPLQVGPIMGRIVVEDVTRDGEINIVTGDINGNVVCFDITGRVRWEMNGGGGINQGLEIVRLVLGRKITLIIFGTNNGKIHCLDGSNGKNIDIFPITLGNSSIVGPIGVFRDGEDINIIVSTGNGKITIMEMKIITEKIRRDMRIMENLKIVTKIGGYDSKIIKAQEKSEILIFTGSHSIDIDDIVYSKPIRIIRNNGNNINQELFKTSKIYKKIGWDKMKWEKRVEEVKKQQEKQKKYEMIVKNELEEENSKSYIIGTKNGMIICVDMNRKRKDIKETNNIRGIYIKNIDIKEKEAVIIVEYEEVGDKAYRIIIESSDGQKKEYMKEKLEEHTIMNNQETQGITTYSFVIDIPSRPQTITLKISGYNSKGIKTENTIEYSVHTKFYQYIPEMIIIPFFILCLSIIYLLNDYWKIKEEKEEKKNNQ
ncbi:hypothetical protein EDI_020530 [Entamoeba dispar SAW760]|uniref:Uncharacterized protein n=1 Tax=Entamoeba dispar (strain ATCC PRA-260 / SAW760) TaxID=370354 RepID=B0EU10_ENTDS|nr:uncharacterized protein EDI_020530 [Entamoeba dispar SAW760]EDR21979.1 hypothetical protein EDI_020530 [Entamoeba dispar SAW760]|eukprot:EDR21979.1 hypothetical protein EDI_020530 [Entamoeba dispar SAW760]